jgi:hypothetical protein
MTQLSLFDFEDDSRPLPLIIADSFGFSLQSYHIESGQMFSVIDWIRGVAQTDNAARFWSDQKKRATKAGRELYASCVQLKYAANDGKRYTSDFADDQTLYTIAQYMAADTGIRAKVLAYLAKAGVKLDEYRRDPAQMIVEGQGLLKRRAERYIAEGRPKAWAGSRGLGIMSHAEFKAELYRVCPSIRFGLAINTEYRGLFGSTAAELREQRGITKRGETRDGLTLSELHLLGWVEAEVSELFAGQDNAPEDECLRVIEDIAMRARSLRNGRAS